MLVGTSNKGVVDRGERSRRGERVYRVPCTRVEIYDTANAILPILAAWMTFGPMSPPETN